uniref:Uncharacterized protein n=1 Tax=Lepeophtheirus salmonis TaxID=72036 RepID=A0A0K2UI25_LEPSM
MINVKKEYGLEFGQNTLDRSGTDILVD